LSVALAVAVHALTVAALKHSIVSAVGGTVIAGGVVSLTRKSLVVVAAPPQLSVALAVAVHALTVAALKHSIVSAVGGTVIAGGVVSLTRKSLVAVAVLPQLSVAVKVTVTVRLQLSAGGV